jgi:ketosteroid isomerase-like protein
VVKPVIEVEVVARALNALTHHDIDEYRSCLHTEVVAEFPYASRTGEVYNRKGLLRVIGFALDLFTTLHFTMERVDKLDASDDVVMQYRGLFHAEPADVSYANRYVTFCEFREGLISRWVEYANPIPFAEALAALNGRGSPA